MITNTLTVHSYITEKMYHSYMKFHEYKRDKSWIHLPILSFAMVVFGICNFMANSPLIGWIFITLAIYIMISRFLRFYTSVNRVCEQYSLSEIPHLFYTVILNGSQIRVTNDKEHASYTWDQVYHAYRVNDMIYLYFTAQTAFLLPTDNMDGGDSTELWQLICESLPKDKATDTNL